MSGKGSNESPGRIDTSFTVFEPALHGPQDRGCAPVPSGAPEEMQVGWIQALLYPSSMVIGQWNVSDTSRCQ